MPGALFKALWKQFPGYRLEDLRPEDATVVPIVTGLFRHGCALRFSADACDMGHFRAVSQHLAVSGRPFRAKSVALEFLDDEEVIPSLQLVADMGAKDFDL